MNATTDGRFAPGVSAGTITATSRWTNLSTFSNHGGKLIFFHGVSDPWFSAQDTIDYYDRMSKAKIQRTFSIAATAATMMPVHIAQTAPRKIEMPTTIRPIPRIR